MTASLDFLKQFADVVKRVKQIDVDGVPVYIRQITALERDEYFAWVNEKCGASKWIGASSYFVALTVCDENGVRLFTNAQDGAKQVGENMPGHIVERIAREATRFNCIGTEAAEELAKN